MSREPEARLFYGYLQPEDDKEAFNNNEKLINETPWSEAHGLKAHGCIVDIHGSSHSLGFYLAVKESYHKAAWDNVKVLTPQELTIKPEWDEQLRLAAQTFGLDISLLQPSWHLVCLYF